MVLTADDHWSWDARCHLAPDGCAALHLDCVHCVATLKLHLRLQSQRVQRRRSRRRGSVFVTSCIHSTLCDLFALRKFVRWRDHGEPWVSLRVGSFL